MLPPAVIFLNSAINSVTQNTFVTQLFINEVMTFDEFNARVVADPNYPNIVHLQNLRILVILPTFRDQTNRNLADLVLFYNQGQVTVEKNNFGPPGLSVAISRFNVYQLLRYNNSSYVTILPNTGTPNSSNNEEVSEIFGGGGIVTEELMSDNPGDLSDGPDEDDNLDFINRK